jgi:hypothetical protein
LSSQVSSLSLDVDTVEGTRFHYRMAALFGMCAGEHATLRTIARKHQKLP